MAFRQPQQRPQTARQPAPPQPAPQETLAQPLQQRKRPLEDSQEWILFAPASVSASQTTTSQTPRTANLSRASEYGSLETRGRSDQIGSRDDDLTCQGTEIEDDENEDLDSLDDGLHAFQAPSSPHLDQSGGTVLPTHDGLGTFPTSYAYAGNEGTQEHLWQYERYNPHRRRTHHRRRSSVQRQMDIMGQEEETLDPHEERRQRVEKWRLEQSKAVIEEIEKESRRRQRRMARPSNAAKEGVKAETASSGPDLTRIDSAMQPNVAQPEDKEEAESFWQRITRRVIRDLIGLDENTLSVIFGEELAEDVSSTPTQTSPIMESIPESSLAAYPGRTWEQRLLERVARELGTLVHQLSEFDGTFSTYTNEPTSPSTTATTPPVMTPQHGKKSAVPAVQRRGDPTTSDVLFAPTLNAKNISPTTATEASLWGLEEETTSSRPIPTPSNRPTNSAPQDPDYWSRDLDVKMIFDYLRTRFSSSPNTPTPEPTTTSPGPLPSTWATTASPLAASALGTSPESLRRADLIRRNHPLVSRAAERRHESLLRRHHTAMLHRRAGSSGCASQSSAKRSRTSTGASRKYWDFPGGAASTGSIATSAGANAGVVEGGWGEV